MDLVLNLLAITALFAGSVTDFRKHEVPYWISYSFLAGAIGIRLLNSIFTSNFSYLLDGLLGLAVFFCAAYLMYKSSQWGGGDVSAAMGIGAVTGLNSSAFVFFILLIFVGAVYGIIWSVYLAMRNKRIFAGTFRKEFMKSKSIFVFASVFLVISLLSFAAIEFAFAFLLSGLALLFLIAVSSYIFVKSVEKSCLIKKVKASQLTEGDWIIDEIRMKGKLIASPKYHGITMKQINALKNYRGKIQIKLGIPFLPAFLIAYVALIFLKEFILTLV
ncbi:prepilin peptidase [Candidatus Woesearchaeota archaeon]|nr:prepilin peptidase [Candidatus Woesearchaeota archaeon]